MISGTFLGGLITKNFSPRISPLMSSVANIASIFVILFLIPNDTKSIKTQRDQDRLTEALKEDKDVSEEDIQTGPSVFQDLTCSGKAVEHPDRVNDGNSSTNNPPELMNELSIGSSKILQEEKMQDKIHQNFEDFSVQGIDHPDQKDELYREKPIPNEENLTTGSHDSKHLCCSDLRKFWRVICLPNMAIVIGLEISVTFASSLLFNMFSMAVMDFYGLDASVNGILLSFIGVTVMLCQGFLVGFLTKRYKDSYLIKISLSLNIIGYLYLSVASKIYMLVLVMIPLLIGGTLAHIIFMVIITKIASDEDTGSALGIIFMLRGLMRAISPSVGGLIFTHIGFPFIGVTGYIIELTLFLVVMFVLKDSQLDLK